MQKFFKRRRQRHGLQNTPPHLGRFFSGLSEFHLSSHQDFPIISLWSSVATHVFNYLLLFWVLENFPSYQQFDIVSINDLILELSHARGSFAYTKHRHQQKVCLKRLFGDYKNVFNTRAFLRVGGALLLPARLEHFRYLRFTTEAIRSVGFNSYWKEVNSSSWILFGLSAAWLFSAFALASHLT